MGKLLFQPLLCLCLLGSGALCSCSTTPWDLEESKVSSPRKKTTPDDVRLCWEKPSEQYRVLSEMNAVLPPGETVQTDDLDGIVSLMRQKAADRGANGLLFRNRKHTAIYRSDNRMNVQTYLQEDSKTGQKYLESKAIWLEETRGTHGGDEASEESLPQNKDWNKIF